MKATTRTLILGLDLSQQREIVRLLIEAMTPDAFCQAFYDDDKMTKTRDQDLSDAGSAVLGQLKERHLDGWLDPEEFGDEIDRLHAAICEGRAQDAIDMLQAYTGNHLRSVETQARLFPDRAVPVDIAKFF